MIRYLFRAMYRTWRTPRLLQLTASITVGSALLAGKLAAYQYTTAQATRLIVGVLIGMPLVTVATSIITALTSYIRRQNP